MLSLCFRFLDYIKALGASKENPHKEEEQQIFNFFKVEYLLFSFTDTRRFLNMMWLLLLFQHIFSLIVAVSSLSLHTKIHNVTLLSK